MTELEDLKRKCEARRAKAARESGPAEVVDFAAYRASHVIDLMDHPSGRDHEPVR